MKSFEDFKTETQALTGIFELYFVEDAPVNAGGASISQGGVNTDGSFDKVAGIDKPLPKRKKKKELESYQGKTFSVSAEEFETLRAGKVRGARWNKYIDEDSELGTEIKKYSLRNPSKPVVIRNEETGEVVFLRRRQNDGRLRHNKS
tara:strand:+ start:1233 stop:1673 length:441 start_codon:yes stop_codon:yes gene_type:complete